jgi:hypothetical protein
VIGCKESKPADPAAKEAPTPTEQPTQARPRPQLEPGSGGAPSDDGRERPRLRDGSGSDGDNWDDPAWREERRLRMEERRKRREEVLDTNKDGVISDEERVQRMEPMRKRLDADGDGKLTPAELGASQGRMSFDDPAAIDTNKDGDISLAELDKAVGDRREQMRERWRGRGAARDAIRGDKPDRPE